MRPGISSICGAPGCGNVQPCEKHKRREEPVRSVDTRERDRFYHTARWRKLRLWFLALDADKHPKRRCGALCWECKQAGRVTAATEVDHIVPRERGGSATDPKNLESLCKSCHSKKTMGEIRARAAA